MGAAPPASSGPVTTATMTPADTANAVTTWSTLRHRITPADSRRLLPVSPLWR
jgi:hypothetical protein